MKKRNKLIFLLVLCAFALALWMNRFSNKEIVLKDDIQSNLYNSATDMAKRSESSRSVGFTPWDVEAASALVSKQSKKPYTIMVYMNGSDLESENGAATDDLIEMLDSGVSAEQVNIILFTGGTNRWQNDVIPENNCVLWKIADGYIEEITGVGLVNMGNAGTLSGFIDFSVKNFPADKYGLILWDHGGGSIAGYGHDEKFNNSNLTLLDLDYAFKMSELSKTKLEFLGFDSCLMASVEMAVVASDYAKFLVASEDLEPGDGWNYDFLSALNRNPSMDGAELGTAIIDYYMDYYGADSDEFLTLSVVDLSSVDEVMDAMGDLMSRCSLNLLTNRSPSFTTFARKRYGTKTFGAGSPRDNECDMVDIGDMANRLSDLFPEEAAKVLKALEESVVYNRHNSDTDLKGLSAYYIYAGRDMADISLPTYASLSMNSDYTDYLHDFANMLNSGGRAERSRRSRSYSQGGDVSPSHEDFASTDLTVWQPVSGEEGSFIMTGLQSGVDMDPNGTWTASHDILWPKIDGKYVCMYGINGGSRHSLYAIPAELNGRDCDIIVLLSERHPQGKILGARQEDGFIIQKGFDKIESGDKIAFYYQKRRFGENKEEEDYNWFKSDEFTAKEELKLDWVKRNDEETFYSLRVTDVCCDTYYTGLQG